MNKKEERLLQKTDSTLAQEKQYAMKLIELTSREVKIHQRRLKSKVGKIKSHLTIEEIQEFRQLERQGKFKPLINTVAVSGAFTIAAATRRLQLKTERKMAAHGLLPDGSATPSKLEAQRQQADRLTKSVPARHRLSTSSETPPVTPLSTARLSFHFRDTDTVCGDDLTTISETPRTPKDVTASTPKNARPSGAKPRPATSVGPRRAWVQHNPPRCKSSSGYSSHEVTEKESRDLQRSQSAGRLLTARRNSLLSNGSLDGALVKGRLAERRQTMLDIEQLRSSDLYDRQQDFLCRVNKWVKENPSTNKEENTITKLMSVLGRDSPDGPTGTSLSSGKKTEVKAKKLRKSNSFHGGADFRKRQDKPVEVHWKDLNKCRYLRIAEEEIDLTGVVTLAKDQMKMLRTFRQTDDEED